MLAQLTIHLHLPACSSLKEKRGRLAPLASGEPLLLSAAKSGLNPWALAQVNGLQSFADQFTGRTLYVAEGDQPLRAWPAPITDVRFRTLPLTQGRTAEVHVGASAGARVQGVLASYTLNFGESDNAWVALQGLPAMIDPGVYPFSIRLQLEDGTTREFSQDVAVASGDYPNEAPLVVNPETLDPAVNQRELETMRALVAAFTPDRKRDVSESPCKSRNRDQTRTTFPSTETTGSPAQMLAIAAAV